jgi:hypothetical protein
MMSRLLCAALLIGLWIPMQAQTKFGIRAGLNTTSVNPEALLILNNNDVEELRLDLERARYGFHLGVFLQVQADFLFIQPEIWFRSNSIDYSLQDLQMTNVNSIVTERYQYLDIPLQFGLKMGPLRLGCGPVGHLFINASSEISEGDYADEYEPRFRDLTVGYIAGLGIDIWNFHVDFNYEGSFQNFGDHFYFFGERYTFDRAPARLIGTIGISF